MMALENVIHYLEMTSRSDFNEVTVVDPNFIIVKNSIKQYKLNRFLYDLIGEPFLWFDKLEWSRKKWQDYVSNDNLHTWVAYKYGSIAGYFELQIDRDDSVEINYFGLTADFIGKGLGSCFLSFAVNRAWDLGAKKIILNTCSKDHPIALKNYLARGFKIMKEVKL